MLRKSLIGIIIAVIVIGVFLLVLTNPNLRENKKTWFGFINVNPDQSTTIPEQEQSSFTTKESTSIPTPKVICDPSYPDLCIPPYPPDLDCADVQFSNFRVLQPDPHGFDTDYDEIGCES
jgi:hypothetical protein